MDPLTVVDSSPCMVCLSSLAYLTSVRSDHLPFCSLWHWRCSLALALPLAPDAICLLHSVDSLVLSYTLVSPSSHRALKSFSTCANLKCSGTFVSVQFKFSVYGYVYADRQTYIHTSCNAVSLVWGSIRLAPKIP